MEPIAGSKGRFGATWGLKSANWEPWNQYIQRCCHAHLNELVPRWLLATNLGTNSLKFQIDAKVRLRAPRCRIWPKSADPLVGRVRACIGGRFTFPLPPSALGPSPPNLGPNIFIRKLYVYWDHILTHGDQILQRGVLRPTLASI